MIEFDNVFKLFWIGMQCKVIFDCVLFWVEFGCFVGIFVLNGIGKIMLINMMCGLEKFDEGMIWLNCCVLFLLGFMGGIIVKFSVNENVCYIVWIYGFDFDYVEVFCCWLIDINEYFDMFVGIYSVGMWVWFIFFLMLVLEFDVYLIDEGMFIIMDVEFNCKVGMVLYDWLKLVMVVVVLYQVCIIEKFCNFVVVLCDGKFYQFEIFEEVKQYYDYIV